jgi:hypothetical protein
MPNELTEQEMWEAMAAHEEAQKQELRDEGAEEFRIEVIRMLDAELSWKTQDEGFRGALQWMKAKLEGQDII